MRASYLALVVSVATFGCSSSSGSPAPSSSTGGQGGGGAGGGNAGIAGQSQGGSGGVSGSGGSGTSGSGGVSGDGGSGQGGGNGMSGSSGQSGSGGSSGGSSCDFNLLASGDLSGAPYLGLAGPAVVATSNGFFVAYESAGAMNAAFVLQAIALDGTPGQASATPVSEDCDQIAGDQVAAATDGTNVLIAAPHPTCMGPGPGISFAAAGPDGVLGMQAIFSAGTTTSPHLGRDGLISWAPGYFRVVYDLGGQAFADPTMGPNAAPNVTPLFANLAGNTFVAAAATDQIAAYVADGQIGNVGATYATVQPLATEPSNLAGALTLPASKTARIAASGTRAVVAQQGVANLAPETVAFTLVDMTGTTAGSAVPGAVGFDVAVASDRIILAAGQTSAILLYRFPGFSSTPAPVEEGKTTLVATTAMGTASLQHFDGHHVAMAAAGGKVLVAWLSKDTLDPNDPTGGFALFSCE